MVRQGRLPERLRETLDAGFVGFRPKLIGLDERGQKRCQEPFNGEITREWKRKRCQEPFPEKNSGIWLSR